MGAFSGRIVFSLNSTLSHLGSFSFSNTFAGCSVEELVTGVETETERLLRFYVLMTFVEVQGQIFVVPPHDVASIATKGTDKLTIIGSPGNGIVVSRVVLFSSQERVDRSCNKICGYPRDAGIIGTSTGIIIDIFLWWVSCVYSFIRIVFHGTQAT